MSNENQSSAIHHNINKEKPMNSCKHALHEDIHPIEGETVRTIAWCNDTNGDVVHWEEFTFEGITLYRVWWGYYTDNILVRHGMILAEVQEARKLYHEIVFRGGWRNNPLYDPTARGV